MTMHEFSRRRGAARVAVICVALAAVACDTGSRLGEGVTKGGLLSLRPGLTQEQVIERLGPPLARTRKPGDHIPGVEDEPVESIVLTYGEPGLLGGGFELSVLLHDGRLVSAGCEVYDLGIYRCDRRECPVIWDEHALDRLPADD